ncbi:Hypothetical protein PBC10988_27230 [Planctomycetales bacterium 10988]|nr:Hypothetical protein PBC10988_27230 [Planctomycetales bacterium 10988]
MNNKGSGNFFITLVMIAVLIGLGFYAGWFSMSADTDSENSQDEVAINLKLNRDEIKEDFNKLGEATEKVSEKLGEAVEETVEEVKDESHLEGEVLAALPAENQLKIQSAEEGEITILVNDDSKLMQGDDAIDLEKIHTGDRVSVVTSETEGDSRTADKVMLLREDQEQNESQPEEASEESTTEEGENA